MDKFYKIVKTNKPTRKDFSKEKIETYIKILLDDSKQKDALAYYVRRHFAVKRYKNEYVLIDRKNIDDDRVVPYVYFEEIYDTLKVAHLNCCHGGIKKTFLRCKLHAANVKISHVKAFLSTCDSCNDAKERRKKKREYTPKMIISSGFGARGQVDLIDIQKLLNDYRYTDKRFRFVLNYQDHYSKFCILRALRDKKAETIVRELKDIFLTVCAPKILQTDNGGEFVNKCLGEFLASDWPDVTHIRGSPYKPQTQGSVERANGDVKRMLQSVLAKRGDGGGDEDRVLAPFSSSSIANALKWIQFVKNTSVNRTLKTSPYQMVFGIEPPTNYNIVAKRKDLCIDIDDKTDKKTYNCVFNPFHL